MLSITWVSMVEGAEGAERRVVCGVKRGGQEGRVCREALARRETTYLVDNLIVRPFSLPSVSLRHRPSSKSTTTTTTTLGRSRRLACHRAAWA